MTEPTFTYAEERNEYNLVVAEGHILKGQKTGLWIEYYSKKSMTEGLRVKARGFYENGQKNGRWYEYHHNGSLKGIGHYKDGHKVGVWNYFNKDGNAASFFKYPDWDQPTVAKHLSPLPKILGKVFPRQRG